MTNRPRWVPDIQLTPLKQGTYNKNVGPSSMIPLREESYLLLRRPSWSSFYVTEDSSFFREPCVTVQAGDDDRIRSVFQFRL